MANVSMYSVMDENEWIIIDDSLDIFTWVGFLKENIVLKVLHDVNFLVSLTKNQRIYYTFEGKNRSACLAT